MTDELDPNAEAPEILWNAELRREEKLQEKQKKLFAEYGLSFKPEDLIRRRLESLISYMLGEKTNARLEFETGWNKTIEMNLEDMHNKGVQHMKELRENAASDHEAAQELAFLLAHRKKYGIEDKNISLLVPKNKLHVPGRG